MHERRSARAAFPDVPTLKEQGLPDLEVDTWYAALRARRHARRGGREAERRHQRRCCKMPRCASFLEKQGMIAGRRRRRARSGELLKRELARWTRVVKAAGIKAD